MNHTVVVLGVARGSLFRGLGLLLVVAAALVPGGTTGHSTPIPAQACPDGDGDGYADCTVAGCDSAAWSAATATTAPQGCTPASRTPATTSTTTATGFPTRVCPPL